ncbi:FliM/FliN family flagellar motor switch protein [Tropicimonas sp. S265A]|uniref:FliM/FliN family flagellar motor switch protein n=1 Tax=Tropicimonas sp. S265A TaxID=3415134 RepID=UPI003C7B8D0B
MSLDQESLQTSEQSTPLVSVPIEVTVSVGQAHPTVRELLALRKDSVLTLDRRIEDPVELFVGAHLIARGVLEENEDASGLRVRLTDVIAPEKAF